MKRSKTWYLSLRMIPSSLVTMTTGFPTEYHVFVDINMTLFSSTHVLVDSILVIDSTSDKHIL